MNELLLLKVGQVKLALPLMLVNNIQSAKNMLAGQQKGSIFYVSGVDGNKTPIVDLATLFEQQPVDEESEHKKLILVETPTSCLGLIVGRVGRVISAESSRISPLSSIFEDLSLSCFPGVLRYENDLFLILSPERILNFASGNSAAVAATDRPGNNSHHLQPARI